TWNQQGPTGPAGPQGPAGAQGLQGLQGARAPSSFLSFTGGVKNGILLSLPGIAGDSTVKGHKGDIGLQDFSFGGATSTAAHGKTGEIIVVKRIDNSSPKLFRAAATGEHFKNAKITLRK